ncbi:MAG: hypothetical protein ACLP59_31190 [Bryobacteraceae bacterium]
MRFLLRFSAAAVLALALTPLPAQQSRAPRLPPTPESDAPALERKPDEVLKADHEKDLKDAAQLVELAQQLKAELEKNDRHVLSIASLKKTEEIEKLAKHIHSRLVR